jgi:hypothetical protein
VTETGGNITAFASELNDIEKSGKERHRKAAADLRKKRNVGRRSHFVDDGDHESPSWRH